MTRPALVLIAHGLLAAAVALANAEETSRSKSMKLGELGYTVKSWSQEDGVPANYVASITQTLDGYLWWESKWGMLRFDGVQAKPFPVPVSPEGGRRAQHVFCDSSGRLWFARDRNAGFVKGARLQWHTPLSGDPAPLQK